MSPFFILLAYLVDDAPMLEELFVGESYAVIRIVDMHRQCAHSVQFHDFESSSVEIFQAFRFQIVTSIIKSRNGLA